MQSITTNTPWDFNDSPFPFGWAEHMCNFLLNYFCVKAICLFQLEMNTALRWIDSDQAWKEEEESLNHRNAEDGNIGAVC